MLGVHVFNILLHSINVSLNSVNFTLWNKCLVHFRLKVHEALVFKSKYYELERECFQNWDMHQNYGILWNIYRIKGNIYEKD